MQVKMLFNQYDSKTGEPKKTHIIFTRSNPNIEENSHDSHSTHTISHHSSNSINNSSYTGKNGSNNGNNNRKRLTLALLLSDEEGFELFAQHLVTEFSIEVSWCFSVFFFFVCFVLRIIIVIA